MIFFNKKHKYINPTVKNLNPMCSENGFEFTVSRQLLDLSLEFLPPQLYKSLVYGLGLPGHEICCRVHACPSILTHCDGHGCNCQAH